MAEAVLDIEKVTDQVRTIDDLIQKVVSYHPAGTDISVLKKAFKFSENAHKGQLRRSGEAYIFHPLSVAGILAELNLDLSSVVTGLLHDTVEDTQVTLQDIEREFGKDVSLLVDGVTKISKINFKSSHQKQGENVRKMIIAMGRDVRVVLVKLADRLHNMRTLTHMPYEKQANIAQETIEIYAPLANRLGINAWKTELEDLCLRYLKPDIYYSLVQKVSRKKKEREKYIDEVKTILKDQMEIAKIPCEIQGRPKHLYSIYKKMHDKNLDYDQLYDVLAFRVVVNSIAKCYEALGVVHSQYKPIPGRFKDFIAMMKTNHYQSLHTAVIGPEGERIEIQIRTEEMHIVAERGIAAHWKYKEGNVSSLQSDNKFEWMRDLVSTHQQTQDGDEFLETIKNDLFDHEIYVFTPKGEVREFPAGSTPIDFAYSVHTEMGNRCVGAKVNGRIVPLKHKFANGDMIEILTSPHQNPHKDWLKFCVTTRAQSRIRQFIRNEERRRAHVAGLEILEKEFKNYGLALNKFLKTPEMEKAFKHFGVTDLEELSIQVGFGKILPSKIVENIAPNTAPIQTESETFLGKVYKSAVKKSRKTGSLVRVDGMSDVLVRYARCCNPIPGDAIVGSISLGRGVSVHQASCRRVYDTDEQRRVAVEWTNDLESVRNTKVRVMTQDKPGLLKLMSECFSVNSINIHNADIRTTKDKKAICVFEVAVKNKVQLLKLMQDLQKIGGVLQVDRVSEG